MPKIKTNSIHVAYETTGAGHPLLLITGVGYGKWFWHKIIAQLSEHFRVITFDNRGAGESDKPKGPYTVPMMAADTLGLLDHLGILEAHVLGHSLGGYIAQEIAVKRPRLISKMILASTNFGGSNVIPITPEAYEVLTNREGDPTELVKRGIAIACSPGFEQRKPEVAQELMNYRFSNPVPPEQYQAQVMAGAAMGSLSAEEVDSRMSHITSPTLILFGEHDKVVPPGNAELLSEKISGSKVKIIPNAGHVFPIEDPESTATAIIEFLHPLR